MLSLYPEIETFSSNILETEGGGGHKIYWEESGNPEGFPVIFLHGGPGSGCKPDHRRYFDPEKYRIVIFDQRGCNRSSPQGCVENNTTPDLLRDIEAIRQKLEIDRWLMFGGSWGATLGLLYAETWPERVTGLVLRGTFLARQRDLDWFAKDGGVNRIFPDQWERFISPVPHDQRHDPVTAYYHAMHGVDKRTRMDFARAWSAWAGKVVTYTLPEVKNEEEDLDTLISQVSIETHYAFNRYFIKENQIMNDIARIPDVPVLIIHGRRDLTCPMESSWVLHRALPNSELNIVAEAGHLAGEPAMIDALITATGRMAGLLK